MGTIDSCGHDEQCLAIYMDSTTGCIECATARIAELESELKTFNQQFSKHQAEWWDKEERLRAALESAPTEHEVWLTDGPKKYNEWYRGERRRALEE